MAETEARLNPEILEDLKLAESASGRFSAAGAPAALWELFALCQTFRPLVRAELDRPGAAAPLAPEVLVELHRLRADKEPLIAAVRGVLAAPRDAGHARLQEMLLGFVVVSSAALESAARWKSDPAASRDEATRRLALMESIVERYWKVLPAPAVSFVEPPAVSDVEPPPAAEPEPLKTQAAPPEPPSGLVATAGDGRVQLAWSAVPGAASYRVQRATEFRGPYAPVGDPMDPGFVDTSVVNGTTYFYYVAARNEGGESRRCSRVRARPTAPPAAPAFVAAAPGDGRVTITWRSSPRAARYRVRRALARRGPYTLVGTSDEAPFTDTTVTNGTTYFYSVVAVNAGGKSPHSEPVQATPLASFLVSRAAATPSQTSTGEVPVLEQVAVPALGALPEGVDLERLLDLQHLARLRRMFEETAQKIDVWEAFCVIAQDEPAMRRAVEDILRRWDRGDADGANEVAAGFFERVLKARAEHGALARDLRAYLSGLGVDGQPDALEIALAFIVSATRSRKRAARWLEDPDGHRQQAAAYAEHALGIARQYVKALGPRP